MTLIRRPATSTFIVLSALLLGLSGCKQASLNSAAAPTPAGTLTRPISARVRVIENLNGLYGRVIKLSGDAVRDGNNATFASEIPARQSVTRTFTLDARVQTK